MRQEPTKRDTQEQLLISKWLNEIGLEHSLEEELEPYWADIYVHDLKLVIELDGPSHMKKRDDVRDMFLIKNYHVSIWRIKNKTVKVSYKAEFEKELMRIVEEYSA